MKNPNGYGSVIKLGGKRRKPWALRVTTSWESGKLERKYVGYYPTKKEAQQAMIDYNNGLINLDSNDITFSELFEIFKKKKYPDIQESQQTIYDMAYANCSSFHSRKFKSIRTSDIEIHIKGLGMSYSYKQKVKTLFNQLFKLAIAEDIVLKNYADNVSVGKATVSRKHRMLTDDEIRTLLAHRGDKWIDYLLVLLFTGARLMEIANLEVKDIHLDRSYMIGGSKTEAGKSRIIPLHPFVLPIIEAYMGERYLFESSPGNPMTKKNLSDNLRGARDTLDLDFQNHDLRTTFVSIMTGLNVPKVIIQKIVGHKGDDVTDRAYTDLEIHVLVDAIKKLSNYKHFEKLETPNCRQLVGNL